jgi:uncharacterized SAM-binding protein YcdF (DUF218 family)
MVFFLRKLIEAMMMPIGFCGLLLILALILRRRSLIVAAILVLFTPSTPLVSHLLLEPLESVYPSLTVAAAARVDAVVVLSGGLFRGISPAGVQWGESANRYFAGLDLALAEKARLLVISGGSPTSRGEINQGQVLRQAAISRGFPAERIIVTRAVFTTEDEASAVSQFPGIHSILLVTSAFHMPRAAMLFRSHGLDVSPFPTDQRVLGGVLAGSALLIPDSSPLHGSEMAIREYYGLAVYKTLLFFHPRP